MRERREDARIKEPCTLADEAVKYCLYARKSSEEDERQALSIDSQLKEMTALAKRENLSVIEVRKESFSAKESGQRKVFSELLQDVAKGAFNGILTWAPDRLSRNAGDLGSVVDLMDQGRLTEIRTHSQRFTNSPNEKFLLMILCSQAKLENDNRGINVKRGLKSKVELGWRPGLPPIGYLNEKSINRGQNKIFVDEERAPVVKSIFEKVAYERQTGREIEAWLKETGFATRSGKRMALSMVYRVLNNHFYYGRFEYPEGSGQWYQGSHEPLITKELFERVQDQISVANRPEYGQKEFLFTKMFKCGACGSGITAEEKIKKIRADGSIKRYVYYRCTQKKDPKCREPLVREQDLIQQVSGIIDRLDLNKAMAIRRLRDELERRRAFDIDVLGRKGDEIKETQANIKAFAKYLFMKGSREEKRELLECVDGQILLKNGILQQAAK